MNSLRIATLNLGHQVVRPRRVPQQLLRSLAALELDVLVLTEYVETREYRSALEDAWPFVATSSQVQYSTSASRFANQVAIASRRPLLRRPGLDPCPDVHARTNFLSVAVDGVVITGVRAPAYTKASDWYAYWRRLCGRLDGDVVIGDLNVDPARGKKRDRVLPTGWQVVTPSGVSYRSPKNDTQSAIDHALVRSGVEVLDAAYRPEFFGRWGLDHCPLVIDIAVPDEGWQDGRQR